MFVKVVAGARQKNRYSQESDDISPTFSPQVKAKPARNPKRGAEEIRPSQGGNAYESEGDENRLSDVTQDSDENSINAQDREVRKNNQNADSLVNMRSANTTLTNKQFVDSHVNEDNLENLEGQVDYENDDSGDSELAQSNEYYPNRIMSNRSRSPQQEGDEYSIDDFEKFSPPKTGNDYNKPTIQNVNPLSRQNVEEKENLEAIMRRWSTMGTVEVAAAATADENANANDAEYDQEFEVDEIEHNVSIIISVCLFIKAPCRLPLLIFKLIAMAMPFVPKLNIR